MTDDREARIRAAVLDVWEIHHHDRDPEPGTAGVLEDFLRDLLTEAEEAAFRRGVEEGRANP